MPPWSIAAEKQRRGRDGKPLKGSPWKMSLPKQEFIDRNVSHILPKGFRRVRIGGIYATNQRAQLEIAKTLQAAKHEPAGTTTANSTTTKNQDSLDCEFIGEREGKETYRVRCQKCADEPPMLTEYRLRGDMTMRFLAYITAMQMYFYGKRPEPPSRRPIDLPSFFARIEEGRSELSFETSPPAQQARVAPNDEASLEHLAMLVRTALQARGP